MVEVKPQAVLRRAVRNCATATKASTYSSTAIRSRRNTWSARWDDAVSEASARQRRPAIDHGLVVAGRRGGCRKKKTRRWERRVRLLLLSEFTVSSMRPGWCSGRPKVLSSLLFLSSQYSFLVLLLSCSSITFSNLTEPSASSQRFLPVCALKCPVRGRTGLSKTCARARLTMRISGLTV